MGYNIGIAPDRQVPGKSTIAKLVAKELGFICVDTGGNVPADLPVHFLKKRDRTGRSREDRGSMRGCKGRARL